MFKYIKGIYAMTFEGGIVVENSSGVGFEIYVPSGSPLYKYGEGEEIKVFTAMIVREDDISLYGFHNNESLELFRLLITVSGVGAKAAMSIMSTLSVYELKNAIVFQDTKEISKANGIGKKTAERLILELKDKIGKLGMDGGNSGNVSTNEMCDSQGGASDSRTEAICALTSLGYTKAEAFGAVGKIAEDGLSSEEYIKRALKNLF